MSASWGAMLAVGAGLGGVFTLAFGRTAAFVADAASFAFAGALIWSVRRSMRADSTRASAGQMRPLRDTAEGLRYARRNPTVLALLASKAGFGLSTGLVSLVVVLATERFNSGDGGTGLLLGMRGAGIVLGPILASRITTQGMSRLLVACGISALVNGVAYLVVPWSPGLLLVSVLVLIAHLGSGTQWMLSTYGLQASTPDALRGRIFATDFALVTLTMSISLTVSGAVAQRLGSRPVMAALAGISVAWGLAYLALTRGARAQLDEATAVQV